MLRELSLDEPASEAGELPALYRSLSPRAELDAQDVLEALEELSSPGELDESLSQCAAALEPGVARSPAPTPSKLPVRRASLYPSAPEASDASRDSLRKTLSKAGPRMPLPIRVVRYVRRLVFRDDSRSRRCAQHELACPLARAAPVSSLKEPSLKPKTQRDLQELAQHLASRRASAQPTSRWKAALGGQQTAKAGLRA